MSRHTPGRLSRWGHGFMSHAAGGPVRAAERFFKRWTTAALRSRLEPLRRFVLTARRYQKNILAFVTSRVTNAVAEGINRIVKIVKNRASGFRSLEAFTDLIYLTVGDLDIPGQIPTKFRAL